MVNNKICFFGLLDFYENKESIKSSYKKITLDQRIEYKRYVYSVPFMEEYMKDLIWEYLNDWEESYEKLSSKYMLLKEKSELRRKENAKWDM